MTPVTRRGPNTPPNNTNPNNVTPKSVQAMIDQALLRNSTNGDGSHSLHEDNRRNVQTARPCFYADFMKCQPLNFKGTEGVVGLTRWIENMEPVFNISGCTIENQVKFATCTLLGAALTWWNGQIRTLGPDAYSMTWEVLKKKMKGQYLSTRLDPDYVPSCCKKLRKVDKVHQWFPDNIYGNVSLPDQDDGEDYCVAMNLMALCPRLARSGIATQLFPILRRGNGANPKGWLFLNVETPGTISREIVQVENKGWRKRDCTRASYLPRKKRKVGGKQLKDVPITQNFPKVFPEDLPGLPPARPVEFQIDLIPGATPVAWPPLSYWPPLRDEGFVDHPTRSFPTKDNKEHEQHLKAILELLKKEKLYAMFSKCLAGYYRRFIEGFSKIVKSMTKLTHKGIKFDWGEKEENAFQLIKHKLCSAPILDLPKGSKDFVVYCDASHKGFSAVLMQREKVIAYAS
ncbi:putative reverse transcriptase domain-containing protein [Tanacetum coccineum]